MNNVPGSETLGWGFNIFGPYSDSSITSRLFALTAGGGQWKDPSSNIDYSLPDNIATPIAPDVPSGTAYNVFAGRSEVQEYFSAKAQLGGGFVSEYGAFSGSFNAMFTGETNSADQYYYGIVESDVSEWIVGLETESLDKLTDSVRADIASLPAEYSKSARKLYFAFFNKYGTHYISRVTLGGRLYYNVAIRKSFASVSEFAKIEASMRYEFAGLFGANASAGAQWSQVTKEWLDSRRAQIQVVGGTPDVLASVSPSPGENEDGPYQKWIDGIKLKPAVVDFILRPIGTLFPIARQDAIEQAYRDYLAGGIITVSTSSVPYRQSLPSPRESVPVVVLSGKRIAPEHDPADPVGFLAAVLKPMGPTLTEVAMLNYYSVDLPGNGLGYGPLFDEMARQIEAVTHTLDDYVLVVVSFNWNYYAPPSAAFQGVLRSAGAGSVLDDWMNGTTGNISTGSIGSGWDCTYCLVGRGGSSRTAAEAMDVSGLPWDADPVSTRMRARIDEGGDVIQLNA